MRTGGESPALRPSRVLYVWDYDIDEARFRALLEGREVRGRLDRDWAAVRLLEHASWSGLDFLVDWLPRHHPELL